MKKFITFPLMALIMFVSCSEKEDFNKSEDLVFSFNGNNLTIDGGDKISYEEFSSHIINQGWKNVSQDVILRDGSIKKNVWFDGKPVPYYFFDSTEITDLQFALHSFQYLYEEHGTLFKCPREKDESFFMKILQIKNDSFYCVEKLGYNGKDPLYALIKYQKMSKEEIDKYRSYWAEHDGVNEYE